MMVIYLSSIDLTASFDRATIILSEEGLTL